MGDNQPASSAALPNGTLQGKSNTTLGENRSSRCNNAEGEDDGLITRDTHSSGCDSDEDDKKVPAAAAAATLAAMGTKAASTLPNPNPSSDSSKSATVTNKRKRKTMGISSSERWEEMFQRLKKFKERHSHCSVPNRYPDDPSLGCWVSTQRRHYKKAQQKPGEGLTPERAARLAEMGFEWTGENPRHKNWDIRFAELREFKAKYGHAQVPIGFEDNVQLANWTSTQRQEYKNLLKGKSTRLNDHRIQLLNGVDFAWELQRGGRRRRVTVAQDVETKGDDSRNNNTSETEGKSGRKNREKGNCHTSKSPARSTSLVLPGVALLGGDQEQQGALNATASVRSSGSTFQRFAHRQRTSNSGIQAQLKPPPPAAPVVSANLVSPASMGSGCNAAPNSNQFETTQHQIGRTNATNPANSNSIGDTTNALQAFARTQLLTSGLNRNVPASNLNSYQQALAILANQRDPCRLNLTALATSSLTARLEPPSPAHIHSLLAQQSNQNDRLRHQLGTMAGQSDLASGLANALFLQAATVLLQQQPQPVVTAMMPVLPAVQSGGSRGDSSIASGRVESKTDDLISHGEGASTPSSCQKRHG